MRVVVVVSTHELPASRDDDGAAVRHFKIVDVTVLHAAPDAVHSSRSLSVALFLHQLVILILRHEVHVVENPHPKSGKSPPNEG